MGINVEHNNIKFAVTDMRKTSRKERESRCKEKGKKKNDSKVGKEREKERKINTNKEEKERHKQRKPETERP